VTDRDLAGEGMLVNAAGIGVGTLAGDVPNADARKVIEG
jgi:hypothetical protein